MNEWSPEVLADLERFDDLHVAPYRTAGTPTWIWAVVVDGRLFVRPCNGSRSRWYQAALAQGAGRVTVAGVRYDVAFAPAEAVVLDDVDDAYRCDVRGQPLPAADNRPTDTRDDARAPAAGHGLTAPPWHASTSPARPTASARPLICGGHDVVVHARTPERARAASAPGAAAVVVGDLADDGQVRGLAAQVDALGPMDAIIHNAGVYSVPRRTATPEGHPLTLAVRTQAPYLLTALAARPSRLVFLSGGMHRQGGPR